MTTERPEDDDVAKNIVEMDPKDTEHLPCRWHLKSVEGCGMAMELNNFEKAEQKSYLQRVADRLWKMWFIPRGCTLTREPQNTQPQKVGSTQFRSHHPWDFKRVSTTWRRREAGYLMKESSTSTSGFKRAVETRGASKWQA